MTEHEKINARILDDHFGPNRLSYTDLEKKYGRSKTSLERLCRAAKAEGRQYEAPSSKKIDPRSTAARRPISSLHAYIGLQVLRYRTEHELTYTEMGHKIKTSRAKVGPIEAGSYDLTLVQIKTIADAIGQPMEEILKIPEKYSHAA